MRVLLALTVVVSAAAGCSTSVAVPDIEAFSAAVVKSADLVDKSLTAEKHADAYRAARAANAVSSGALLTFRDGDCQPPQGPDASAIATCELVAYDRAGAVVDIAPATDSDAGLGKVAHDYAAALKVYATALDALVKTAAPEEAGAAAKDLVVASGNLADAVGDGRSSSQAALFATGSDLVGMLSSMALEAWRHKAVKRIATASDPAVREAALGIARWRYFVENARPNDGLTAKHDAVMKADAALSRAPTRADLAEKALAAEEAYAAAIQGAEWRAYREIAEAHGKIVKALEGPKDLSALLAANDSILDLAKKVDAVVKAAETLDAD
ncbi:MAG: hypothetical protein VYD87_16270 [Pseudomonadota bacterium]|nr:hypothetical protein [Pseudomonadota bacterium]MEE3099779.1 hypothetical protein [Pseudomonadota bacterium]